MQHSDGSALRTPMFQTESANVTDVYLPGCKCVRFTVALIRACDVKIVAVRAVGKPGPIWLKWTTQTLWPPQADITKHSSTLSVLDEATAVCTGQCRPEARKQQCWLSGAPPHCTCQAAGESFTRTARHAHGEHLRCQRPRAPGGRSFALLFQRPSFRQSTCRCRSRLSRCVSPSSACDCANCSMQLTTKLPMSSRMTADQGVGRRDFPYAAALGQLDRCPASRWCHHLRGPHHLALNDVLFDDGGSGGVASG
jgi:hypothetical protein